MRTIFLSLICLIASQGYGQTETPQLRDYSIQVWSTDEGLPSNNLIRIEQDHMGYLWITSFNGLIRFDGNTFDIYNTDILPELKSNGFSFISPGQDNAMYFGTLTSGLLTYDGAEFTIDKIENDFSGSINIIHTDNQDRLWVGVKNKGIYFKEDSQTDFVHVENALFKNSIVQCILEFDPGHLWIATSNNGIVEFKGGAFNRVNAEEIGERSINTLIQVDGVEYAGTNNGLYANKQGTWELLSGTEGYFINSMKYDDNGYLWVATETGLIRKNLDGDIEYLTVEDGLPSRQISSVLFDSEGNIWLTSKRGGLVQLRSSNFVNISIDDGLSNQYANIIYELSDESFLVGNDNGSIDLIKDGIIKPFQVEENLANISIKDIIQDSRENTWIATYKGLLRVSEYGEHLYTPETGMVSRNIRSLFEDSKGNIWVGAKDGGIVKITGDTKLEVYSEENGLSDNYVFSFDELSDGRIVAGTYHGGLNIISENNSIEVLKLGNDESSPLIFNIHVVNDSTFWLATDVGLYKYFNRRFNRIGLKDGLSVSTIFDIYPDRFGYLWATSNLGLVRMQISEIDALIAGNRERINARLYDEKDGMLSRECTGATKVLIAESGKIRIPTSKGISIVDPANIYVNKNAPPVLIKSVTIDEKTIHDELYEITAEPGSQRITFDYTALSYYSPQKINFKYRLNGYDNDWKEVGNQYQATYMNLPDGNFSFEVLAANNEGLWSDQAATVILKVEPFFYKSRLFILLSGSFILAIAFFMYWIRIRVVEEKNRELHKLNSELDSFVYSVSHDLRAPLSSILGLISVSKIDDERKNLPMYLDKIEKSVNKLDNFIKEIISYSRNVRLKLEVESFDLKILIEEILESLAYMNTDNVIDISLEASGNTMFSTDKTRLQVILNNVISNSFRYFKPYINDPYIKIKVSVVGQKAVIVVQDNGIGIKRDQLKKIFDMFYRATETSSGSGLGLYIAKESADKIEGKIGVESTYEQGTTFTITLDSL